MSKRRSERCFTYGGVIYFRFIILKCIVKKMLFCIKRSFVWLKKIVFDESFYEIVLLLIQFFSCTWLLLFLWAGRLCNVLPDWGCFFNHLMIFFQWFDEIQSRFFFLWDFLCLVSLRRGRFFSCWFVKKVFVEWIGSFVAWVVGEFCLLLIHFFSCTWLLLFLWAGRLCNVLSDLRLFFYSFDDFFSMIWWKTITVFFSVVFFCEIFCLVSLIRGRFFSCWFIKKVFVEWIGSFVEWDVGEFVFFSDSNFSLWD